MRDSESVRGCFVCVKFKDNEKEINEAIEYGIEHDKSEIEKLREEITRLKAELNQTVDDRYATIIKDFEQTKNKPAPKKIIVKGKRQVITVEEISSVYDLFSD